MSLSNIPRANVYDLRSLKKLPPFKYFFDTNVLKFIFVPIPFKITEYQKTYYPKFYRQILSQKSFHFTFTQNLLELFSVIDNTEKEYLRIDTIKTYRKDNLETYIAMREGILDEIKKTFIISPSKVEASHIDSYFKIDCPIDLNDFIYFELANAKETAFVTDDFEFIYLKEINVFTANAYAIDIASRFKKLIV